jgi:hypothetical protein
MEIVMDDHLVIYLCFRTNSLGHHAGIISSDSIPFLWHAASISGPCAGVT